MSDINYNTCYPGIAQNDDFCFRFFNKDTNEAERTMFDNAWREQINMYGQKVTYYVNAYNINTADNIYGEQPTKEYSPGVEIIMAVEINEQAEQLTRIGFQSDDEVTAIVHISSFYSSMQSLSDIYNTQFGKIEPKSGDVFALTEYGSDRHNGRGPKMFEVTDRVDQDASSMNLLGGHYTWRLKAKRYEYSFEPGLSSENGNDQVFENSFSGIVSSVSATISDEKIYDLNIDEESATIVFDMSANNDTDIYGLYY